MKQDKQILFKVTQSIILNTQFW